MPSGIQCWDVETWQESGAEFHPPLQLSLGLPLTLSAAQCCGLAPALGPRNGLSHWKRSSMRGLNSWKSCEWDLCQHADQTYLKEMVGNQTLRKGGGSGRKLICELSPRSDLSCRKLWLFSSCEALFPGTNICFQSSQHHVSHFSQVILVWPHHSKGMDLLRITPSFKFYWSALGFIHPWDQVLTLLCPCGFPDEVDGGKWQCYHWIFSTM